MTTRELIKLGKNCYAFHESEGSECDDCPYINDLDCRAGLIDDLSKKLDMYYTYFEIKMEDQEFESKFKEVMNFPVFYRHK